MSDYELYFELGGISVPIQANHKFDQQYQALAGETWPPIRTGDGTGIKQTSWSGKLRTVLSGEGWVPAGLSNLDYTGSMTLKCGAPRALTSASNVITLPTSRRSDTGFAPYGAAIVAGAEVVSSASLASDDLTITTVSGASAYIAYYFPQITVLAKAPDQSGDLTTGTYRWSLEAEEV